MKVGQLDGTDSVLNPSVPSETLRRTEAHPSKTSRPKYSRRNITSSILLFINGGGEISSLMAIIERICMKHCLIMRLVFISAGGWFLIDFQN